MRLKVKMIKFEETICPICKKKIRVKTWIQTTGLLKGEKIVDIWKHKDCKRYFYLVMLLDDIQEELEKLKKKIRVK